MNRILRAAIMSAAVAATALAPAANAFAGDRYDRDRDHYRYERHQVKKHHRHGRPVIVHRDNSGEVLAAGIIGLALGAIIVGATNPPPPEPLRPERPRPHRDYFPDAPAAYDDEPEVIYAQPLAGAPEPWTPAWYRYCTNRFRSFDGETGTYLGFDGRRHFCVAN
jgi:hypothetical protein